MNTIVNHNINIEYTGGINEQTDLVGFIDESGDEGFDFTKDGVTDWFNVSALICRPTVARSMVNYIRDYISKSKLTRPLHKMTFKQLRHETRRDLSAGLNRYKFLTTHSIFFKRKINLKNNLVRYPSMYFVGIKNVIERMTWCASQYKCSRIHIIISNRNAIRVTDLQTYLFVNSVNAKKNLWYKDRLGIVKLANFNQRPQLLLADYAAYTLRAALEKTGDPLVIQPWYFDLFQKGKLYSSNHKKWKGIWRCGIKCTPDDKSLIQHGGILDEGSHQV